MHFQRVVSASILSMLQEIPLVQCVTRLWSQECRKLPYIILILLDKAWLCIMLIFDMILLTPGLVLQSWVVKPNMSQTCNFNPQEICSPEPGPWPLALTKQSYLLLPPFCSCQYNFYISSFVPFACSLIPVSSLLPTASLQPTIYCQPITSPQTTIYHLPHNNDPLDIAKAGHRILHHNWSHLASYYLLRAGLAWLPPNSFILPPTTLFLLAPPPTSYLPPASWTCMAAL